MAEAFRCECYGRVNRDVKRDAFRDITAVYLSKKLKCLLAQRLLDNYAEG
jgi:hypothetical protein